MTTPKTRPELGELTPGQPVMVRRSMNDERRRSSGENYIPATVVKVARVWVTLKGNEDGWNRTWRMRRDTQDEGTQYSGSNTSFATLDQHAWDEALNLARSVLKDHGIDLRVTSPWRNREIELADILTEDGA